MPGRAFDFFGTYVQPLDLLSTMRHIVVRDFNGGGKPDLATALVNGSAQAERNAGAPLISLGATARLQSFAERYQRCQASAHLADVFTLLYIWRWLNELLLVCHTWTQEDVLRIISARKASRKERNRYYHGHRPL